MSAKDPATTAVFIESFNTNLAELGSAARVALPVTGTITDVHREVLELRDDEGNFLDFIPISTEPRMAAIAYRLYGRGLNLGMRSGEAAAWAKLRHLIGAAPSDRDI